MTVGKLHWAHMVASVQDLRAYKTVVLSMFEDGRVNEGRLLVLKQFTDDVCDQVQQPDAIRHYYDYTVVPTLTDLSTPSIRRLGPTLAVLGVLGCLTCAIVGVVTRACSPQAG